MPIRPGEPDREPCAPGAPPELHIARAAELGDTAGVRAVSLCPEAVMTESYDSPAPVRAPEFPEGLDWAVGAPTRLAELRGRVVVIDLWTYG